MLTVIRAARNVRLLEADPELGDGLEGEEREQAASDVVVPQVELEVGAWTAAEITAAAGVRAPVVGVLVLAGALTTRASLAGWGAAQVLGRGDVLFFNPRQTGSIPCRLSYVAQTEVRLAVLDVRAVLAARRWPHIIVGLCERAGCQVEQGVIQQAISQLPRAEERLLALLWSFADRWGTMDPDGARIEQPFTHADLGAMVGARRPTVSLGLKSLVDSGAIAADGDGWVIRRASLSLLDRGAAPRERPTAARARPDSAAPSVTAAAWSAPRVLCVAASLPPGSGLVVREVADEAAALAALDAETADVVVVSCERLDAEHPGVRLAARLRGELVETRLIALGGKRAPVPEVLLAAAHDFIAGPPAAEDLLSRVRAQLAVITARHRQRPPLPVPIDAGAV